MLTKEEISLRCRDAGQYFFTFVRWVLVSALIGAAGGFVGAFFHGCIEKVTGLREANSWLIFFLPLSGMAIVFIYHAMHVKRDGGTNLILSSIRSEERVPRRMIPLIFLGTVLTHLCGGSAGREGAALQIGGSIGSNVATILRRDKKDRHVYVMCGMSAMFSAMFGTPITAAIFSIEVVSIGVMHYSAMVPCIISSMIAYGIAQRFGLEAMKYMMDMQVSPSLNLCLKVILLACLCGLVSIIFCKMLHESAHVFQKYIKNAYLRVAAGGCAIIVLTLLVGSTDYNGAGTQVIERALYGNVAYGAFLLKILFTAITIGAGFKGGEIVPTLFIGATLGNVLGMLLGIDAGLGAALGMVCMFCSVVNCPLASMMLSLELFGNGDILLFCLGCAVSYVISGYYSLYSSQKIVYSKIHPEFIDRNAK